MDKDKTSLERTILLATSIVGGIGGLFAAINGLSETVRKTVGIFSGFNEWQLGVAALGLVAVSWWLFRLSRRRRSVLLRPDALRLGRDNPAHLAGRAQDIADLTRLCREQSLVFLEGESGTGKPALLQAGLVPALKGDSELLPIYVESLVGADWERDPQRFLAAALWTVLDEAARGVLELKAAPAPDAVRDVIAAIPPKLGRMPLVILDQLDDYQTRHRERFLPRKTWLKPDRLCDQNRSWRDLRELLVKATIHLVVVTRTDTASGLTSVRFIEPETYRLDRLSSHFVGPLLARLAEEGGEQPVIGDPEYGWTTLLTRLAADIERAGTILPQQLKIVLAGLGTLPGRVLSVAAYERAGGAAGLEARFIEDRIAKVARLHGVTEEGVRAALLGLVDPDTGQKTIERRSDDLLVCIDPTVPEKARPALDQLAQEEVIRRRIDPGTGEISWLLDHDYLTRAVREADRRANRWQRALAEGAKALADAGESWARWWRALLPPRTQLGFLYDRLRGRFHYGEYRLYAAKSLQRFGPIIGILLLVAGAGAYEWQNRAEERVAKSAEDILNGLEFQAGDVDDSDAEALLRLASADDQVRQHALTLVLTNPDRARVFIRHPEMVIRAIVGVSPWFRDLAKTSLTSAQTPFSSSRPENCVAISKAALLFGRADALHLDWLLTAIKGTTDPLTLKTLGAGLGAVMAKVGDSQAKEAVEPVLAAIKGTTNPYALEALSAGLGALPAKLSDSQTSEAVEPFLAAVKGTTDPYALGALGSGLGAVPAKLSDNQAKEAIEPFLAAIKRTTNPNDLGALAAGLGALPVKLSDSQAKEAVEPFLAPLEDTSYSYDFQALDAGLGAVGAKFSESQAQEAIELFLAAIKRTTHPSTLKGLATGLGALPAKLSDSQAKEAVEPFLAAINGTTNPDALHDLGEGLGALPAKLSDSQAQEAVEPFLAAIKGTTGSFALGTLAAGLGAVPVKLSDSQAKEAIEPFLAAIKRTTNPSDLGYLAAGLGAIIAKLSDGQAKDAVDPFLAAIKGATDPVTLSILGGGLGAVKAKLSDSQGKEAIELFLAAINGTTDPHALPPLGVGLGALPAKLDDSQTKRAVEPFLAVIKRTTDPYALQNLGLGLDALAAKLDQHSAEAARRVAEEVLIRARDEETFASYAELVAKLMRTEPGEAASDEDLPALAQSSERRKTHEDLPQENL